MHKTIITLTLLVLIGAGLAATGFSSDIDAEALYKRCASCHGEDGSIEAMGGASPALKGQTSEDLFTKMKGYQDESYGGERAKLMITQVRGLSDEELQALADYMAAF